MIRTIRMTFERFRKYSEYLEVTHYEVYSRTSAHVPLLSPAGSKPTNMITSCAFRESTERQGAHDADSVGNRTNESDEDMDSSTDTWVRSLGRNDLDRFSLCSLR